MTIPAIVFLVVNTTAMLSLPRRWAPLPLLVGACYMPLDQFLQAGPLHLTIIRLLIAAGLTRVIIRGERPVGGMNGLDWLMLVWSIWALVSSIFHKDPSQALIFRSGLVYNACGVYFLLRVFSQSLDDVKALCVSTAIVLGILAVAVLYEKMASHNLFSVLGGVHEIPLIRGGKVRAAGPFAHPILAGTVAAACLPLMVGLWQHERKLAFIGVVACISIIFACASSGPIMSAMAAIGALFMWRYREQMRLVRWLVVGGYIALDLFMKAPAYYMLARIDLVGGSTGWHRAALIDSALHHLHEWWLAGTDYTLHWMPTGVTWSGDHTDITSHYIHMGVVGGLPLVFLFIAILAKAFSLVGQEVRQVPEVPVDSKFMLWALGASLFVHSVTFISVSYFDQSFLFIYLTLAAIGSARSATQS